MSRLFKIKTDEKLGERYYYLEHESGLPIYVFPKKMTLKTALLGVKLGSVYEEGSTVDGKQLCFPSGIAHFLEHKLFSNEDGVDAIEALAAVGADANAYTSNNKTVYMFSWTENFGEALGGLIDFVCHPYFTKKNVNSEKGIITQEIKMCNDSPYDVVSQNLLLALYGDCALSRDVLGTEKTIAKITDRCLTDCYNSFYRYSNMALVVCGDVDCDEVLRVVDKFLPEREKSSAPTLPDIPSEAAVHTAYIEKVMPVSTPILEIGIKDEKPSADTEVRLRRDVAMTVLDEMLFSRASDLYYSLFESGLINESYSYGYSITRDAAFHSIYAESTQPEKVLESVKKYVCDVRARGLDEGTFTRCKRVMLAEFIRDFDSVDDVANSLINFVFEGSDTFEYKKMIEDLTFADVCKCFDSSFGEDRYCLSVIKNKN